MARQDLNIWVDTKIDLESALRVDVTSTRPRRKHLAPEVTSKERVQRRPRSLRNVAEDQHLPSAILPARRGMGATDLDGPRGRWQEPSSDLNVAALPVTQTRLRTHGFTRFQQDDAPQASRSRGHPHHP